MFQEKIQARIKDAEHGSIEKSVLKVLLSEIQNKITKDIEELPEKDCVEIIKKMIKDNKLVMKHSTNQKDIDVLDEENLILESLLPEDTVKYWSQQDIKNWVCDENIDPKSFKNSGQAISFCMAKLKGMSVQGSDVKEVIEELRK